MNLLELLLIVIGLIVIGHFNYRHIRRTAERLQEQLIRD